MTLEYGRLPRRAGHALQGAPLGAPRTQSSPPLTQRSWVAQQRLALGDGHRRRLVCVRKALGRHPSCRRPLAQAAERDGNALQACQALGPRPKARAKLWVPALPNQNPQRFLSIRCGMVPHLARRTFRRGAKALPSKRPACRIPEGSCADRPLRMPGQPTGLARRHALRSAAAGERSAARCRGGRRCHWRKCGCLGHSAQGGPCSLYLSQNWVRVTRMTSGFAHCALGNTEVYQGILARRAGPRGKGF